MVYIDFTFKQSQKKYGGVVYIVDIESTTIKVDGRLVNIATKFGDLELVYVT